MMTTKEYSISAFLLLFILSMTTGCHLGDDQEGETLFKNMPEAKTSIDFSNDISYDESFNIINFSYLYNGGGVAAGDINNDGLTDLYFTGNMVSSRLYLNRGNFEFEDITESSGTGTDGWAGGASMIDINNDNYLDIYVSVSGTKNIPPEQRKNLLFINNQDGTFTESAEEYGLADTGYTTHAAFFDYDRDGDLDVYLMNNFPGSFSRDSRIGLRKEINDGTSKSADALYRNNGDGTFTDVSQEAGILKEGYSLGIGISDINRDGWPDIYISNDIQTDDLLYINNRDDTFTDKSDVYFKHTSYAGMGADIADFNNDGWPDVLQVDMLPPSLEEKHQVTGSVSYDFQQELEEKGYQHQYTLNTLQLNNGMDQEGNIFFSDIAQMAGVHATDWSWSALFGDYDNDGWKDIMITNGYPKAVNNYDYLINISQSTMFGSDSSRKQRAYDMMDQLEGYKTPNYFFKNERDLTFSDRSEEWGFTAPSYSYGAVHTDLDNDGDLDIAINNVDGPAQILQNRVDTLKPHHYLTLQLRGDSLNRNGIGATITLTANGQKQYRYVNPYRGYQSTMDTKIYFGLGSEETIDSLEIMWPDSSYQLLEKVEADQVLELDYENAQPLPTTEDPPTARYFVNTENPGIDYEHTENEYVDFMSEPLLPRMLSRLGPAVAVGDVNNDGLEDLFLGGANGSAGTLYLQQKEGDFVESDNRQAWLQDTAYEDIDATFFDANDDGWQDLYVVSGGNRFSSASEQLQDRLYLNSGNGDFIKAENMLPRMYTSGSVVKAADYDDDGDQDLFVGGRHVPGQYPKAARSYILRNDGGSFTNVTSKVAPDLVEPGLITDATWVDFNEDGAIDLVTTGIWMPVRFFENQDGQFQDATAATGLERQVGWWQSIEKADLDGDGDMDLVAGNLGLNTRYSTPDSPPLEILVNDFDDDQRRDAILAVEKEGEYYPIHGMRSMAKQVPQMTRKVQSFQVFSVSSLSDIFGEESVNNAHKKSANYFASSIIMNEDGADFLMKPLPNEAQLSPVNDILISNINKDASPDLIIAGNIYNPNPETVRNDAGNGLLLLGTGEGDFKSISPFESEFLAPRNVKKLSFLETEQADYVLVVNNNSRVQVLQLDR